MVPVYMAFLKFMGTNSEAKNYSFGLEVLDLIEVGLIEKFAACLSLVTSISLAIS